MAIAYFSTWTTYGTWLPGDERYWFERHNGLQLPDPARRFEAELRMTESAVILDDQQRLLVESTIRDHCRHRNWLLHDVNCRSNHVHVCVTAADYSIEIRREQFKSWCTRRLKLRNSMRKQWWTERGWDVFVDDEESLAAVVAYIRNQDVPR